MYYYLYKVTNWFNGKIYVGVHKTDNLDDGYMGSGVYLRRAQEKYGLEYFTKEILQVFDSAEEMFEAESQIVNEEFIKDSMTYNLKLGGFGGWGCCNGDNHNNKGNCRKTGNIGWKVKAIIDDEYKLKISMGMKKAYQNGFINPFLGKEHTEETKRKIGEANSIHQQGEKNSQFGKVWIHNMFLRESKPVDLDEVDWFIANGWIKGRFLNFDRPEEIEKEMSIRIEKKKEKNKEIIESYKEIFDLYKKIGSYRLVAEHFNISHVSVFNRIKKYEQNLLL